MALRRAVGTIDTNVFVFLVRMGHELTDLAHKFAYVSSRFVSCISLALVLFQCYITIAVAHM